MSVLTLAISHAFMVSIIYGSHSVRTNFPSPALWHIDLIWVGVQFDL
ncbi:hypothetical protein VPHD260_0061 [Vibrio phage D260]